MDGIVRIVSYQHVFFVDYRCCQAGGRV